MGKALKRASDKYDVSSCTQRPAMRQSSIAAVWTPGRRNLAQGVIGWLNEAINACLRMQTVKDQLISQGVDIAGGSSDDLDLFMKQDMEKWAKLIKASNIQLLD